MRGVYLLPPINRRLEIAFSPAFMRIALEALSMFKQIGLLPSDHRQPFLGNRSDVENLHSA